MDIENIWRQHAGKDDTLKKLLQGNNFSNFHSKLPLKKLKINLLTGIIWAVVITAAYIALFFFIAIWQVLLALTLLIFVNTWIIVLSWRLYKSINEKISASNSLKEELQRNYDDFKKWWLIQQRLGLLVYPIGAGAGFIIGGVLGSDKPIEVFLYNSNILSILGISILVLVPLCYYGAKGMYHYVYGKHLKKIKLLIDELSA